MEKLSNSKEAYWNRIIRELLDNGKSEEVTFRYLELGQLLTHGYSIAQLKRHPQQLKVKTWNAPFDNSRFNKGIYNLDRLAISDHTLMLSTLDQQKISNALETGPDTKDWGGITLDGLWCQLEFKDIKFNWNSNYEINKPATEMVELLRAKVYSSAMLSDY